MKKLVILVVALCCQFQAHSQVSQPLSKQTLKMPGPDVQNVMLGKWSINVTYPPTQEMPKGDTGVGTEVWRPGPGGLSVIEEYRERNSKGEIEGFGIAWWDKEAQGQRFVWCESGLASGCYVSKNVAKWESESLVWKEEQQIGGVKTAYSEVFRAITPTSFVQELQQGESVVNLHTTALIRASRINNVGSEDDLRRAMKTRHEAMLTADEQLLITTQPTNMCRPTFSDTFRARQRGCRPTSVRLPH